MTPERHDDVEDVVGRARGDVPPEEIHERALLVAFVRRDAARRVDSFEVGQVPSPHLGLVWSMAPHIEIEEAANAIDR